MVICKGISLEICDTAYCCDQDARYWEELGYTEIRRVKTK